MRKTLLSFAIAACMTAPVAFAQGQGGGQGRGGNVGGTVGGASGQMGGQMGGANNRSMQDAIDRSSFGRDTADRARTLQDATVEERTQFGADQSAAAQAKNTDSTPTEDTDDDGVADSDASTFGQDTAARARELKDADVETRSQFGADQSTRAEAQGDGDDADDTDDTDDGDDNADEGDGG